MEKQRKETSFERMNIAVREMVKEDLGVEAICCKSHTSKTLKVVAYPDAVNTVDVFVPYQIFVGAKTNEVCIDWDVNYWKMALRQLCLEFGVKECPRTRLMVRKDRNVNPRTYAEFFWKGIECMEGWNIVVPEIPAISQKPVLRIDAECASTRIDNAAESEKAKEKIDIESAYEMLGLKFACL